MDLPGEADLWSTPTSFTEVERSDSSSRVRYA
jgi:hypothetical protein